MTLDGQRQEILTTLKDLTEGRFSTGERPQWREDNESSVADRVSRVRFLRMKSSKSGYPDRCALRSGEEARAILEEKGIPFGRRM